jgi:hypothetical protein
MTHYPVGNVSKIESGRMVEHHLRMLLAVRAKRIISSSSNKQACFHHNLYKQTLKNKFQIFNSRNIMPQTGKIKNKTKLYKLK